MHEMARLMNLASCIFTSGFTSRGRGVVASAGEMGVTGQLRCALLVRLARKAAP